MKSQAKKLPLQFYSGTQLIALTYPRDLFHVPSSASRCDLSFHEECPKKKIEKFKLHKLDEHLAIQLVNQSSRTQKLIHANYRHAPIV